MGKISYLGNNFGSSSMLQTSSSDSACWWSGGGSSVGICQCIHKYAQRYGVTRKIRLHFDFKFKEYPLIAMKNVSCERSPMFSNLASPPGEN